jgi:two-component system, cell cycle sensor histidine kinase and response regulator CckA
MKKSDPDEFFPKKPFPLEGEGYQPDSSLLSSLIQSLPLNIYAKDKNGNFIFANTYYCRSVGKQLSEIIGKTDHEIHPGKLAEKYLADDRRIMATQQAESIEEKWQSLGGEPGYIQVIKSPLYESAKNKIVIGTIGVFWDITKRKKAEILLAEEKNLLRTVIDNLPDYIYVKDLQSKFVLANKAVANLMGAKHPDALLGTSDLDYYSEKDASKFRDDEMQIMTRGRAQTDIEEFFHTPMGAAEWCLTSKLPLKNLNGEIIGMVGIGHNITERKKNEEERKKLESQLLQSQKMETIGTLAAGIAHDFNNILNVINGYTELLMLKKDPESPEHATLEKIMHAGRSAAELVNQLMMFSRKSVTQPKVIDFNLLLTNTQHMLRRIIGEEIDIQQNLSPDLWPIKIDPAQMEQIVINLAANARDAMQSGGVLKMVTKNVSTKDSSLQLPPQLSTGEYICFIVSDNGSGIEKEYIDRIFEPFFTTKAKHKGTGLGLATVLGIIQQNKGTIDLKSDKGKGTTFRIFLPRSTEQKDSAATMDRIHKPAGGTETLLVVEDRQDVRDLVADILRTQGYNVLDAPGGKEALEVIKKLGSKKIDLLVTDVVMPGMSGKELAKTLLLSQPETKILFMSGYTDDTISQYDIAHPGKAFIQKPFNSNELGNAVRELLDEPSN